MKWEINALRGTILYASYLYLMGERWAFTRGGRHVLSLRQCVANLQTPHQSMPLSCKVVAGVGHGVTLFVCHSFSLCLLHVLGHKGTETPNKTATDTENGVNHARQSLHFHTLQATGSQRGYTQLLYDKHLRITMRTPPFPTLLTVDKVPFFPHTRATTTPCPPITDTWMA